MRCAKCDLEMKNISDTFDSKESHLMGPGWSHFNCDKCGEGTHMQQETTVKIIPGKKLPDEIEEQMKQLKEKQDEIEMQHNYIKELKKDEELNKLATKWTKAENAMNERKTELGIQSEEETLNVLEQEKQTMLSEIAPKIENDFWGKDAFSKGKKDAAASEDGTIVLLRSSRTERTIIPDKFWQMYPFLIEKYIKDGRLKITLKEASKDLGETQIDEIANKKTTFTYELVIKDGRNIPCKQ